MTRANGFAELIGNLEKRGGMYVQPFNYDTLVAYLLGFDYGLASAGQKSVLEPFSEWLEKKVGHECSLHWSGIVRTMLAKKNDESARQQLFALLKEYLDVPASKVTHSAKRQRAVS